MALLNLDNYINQIASGYSQNFHFSSQYDATASTLHANQLLTTQGVLGATIPATPDGVSGYRITNLECYSNKQNTLLVAKAIPFGLYLFESDTYTSYSSMPTVTEGNVSRQTYSALFVYGSFAKTAGTDNTVTFEYIDQDNHAAENTSAYTLSDLAPVGTGAFIPLNSDDYGVRNVTNVTISGSGTYIGAFLVLGLLPIGLLSPKLQSVGTGMQFNLLTNSPTPVEINSNDNLIYISTNNDAGLFVSNASLVGVT